MITALSAAGRWCAAFLTATLCGIWAAPALCQPPTVNRHTAIYDAFRQRMVVFGGEASTGPTNATWALSMSLTPQWELLTPGNTPPSPRTGHSAIHDRLRDRMLVFGGLSANPIANNDLWALSFSTSTWDNLLPSGDLPAGRHSHTAIYDAVYDRMVVFGGFKNTPLDTVWFLWLSPAPRWEPKQIVGGPGARWGHSAIYDSRRQRMVIFSGLGAPPTGDGSGDVWALSLDEAPAWRKLHPSGTLPTARAFHSAIYDSLNDRMVLFGGTDLQLNDQWSLSFIGADSSRWERLLVVGAPLDPRDFHSAIYDRVHERMMVFGGFDAGNALVDDPTWALSLGSMARWSPLRPVLDVSATDLRIPTVTLGDTISVPLVISSVGLDPLRIDDIRLPSAPISGRTEMRFTSPDPRSPPFDLHWNETIGGTLWMAPVEARRAQDSVVIVSNDPRSPRQRVSVTIDVRGIDFTTRALTDSTHVPLGVPFLVIATPDDSVRAERGVLLYRIPGASLYDSLSLTRLGKDFIAAVPATAVTERGVEYYIRLENGDFSATQPAGAPAAAPSFQSVAGPTSILALPRPNSGSDDFLKGTSIEVEVVLPAGTVFLSGTIHYRQGGEQDYEIAALAIGGLGRPIGIIPSSVVGFRGIECWLEVVTLQSTLRVPIEGNSPMPIQTRVQNLVEANEHPAARYRLLSVPLDFGSFAGSLDALLIDQLGTYDPVRWRAYAYDTSIGGNVELPSANATSFQPTAGRAFWLISRAAHRVDTKPIDGLSTRTNREYEIPLAQGWNLFGNPFDFPVRWSDVHLEAGVVGDPFAFDPGLGRIGDYAAAVPSVLVPFEGYFIHATRPTVLGVPPRAASAVTMSGSELTSPATAVGAGTPTARNGGGDLWRFRLQAGNEEAMDGTNEFGIHALATEGFDGLDQRKPPPSPGARVQVAFDHPDWQEHSGSYRRDLRGPGAEGETWEIGVRSSAAGEAVTIEVSEIVPPSPQLAVRLIDREQGSSIEWSRKSAASRSDGAALAGNPSGLRHSILAFGQRPYRLAVAAGTEEYVTQATQALSIPTQLMLYQNAPNPFETATQIRFGLTRAQRATLEIFDVLGHRVSTLCDGQVLPAGYHTRLWEGRGPGGGKAPSGVYLIRLVVDGDIRTKRLVLTR